ncbi:MAG: type II secretion system F family protein [Candidatus Aenigmarchaeota archaeon]|nr:type II secretion system F family protein [Candidatus Aenigmarchaeota archaeon]
MSLYTEIAFKVFSRLADELAVLFPTLPDDIKKGGMKTSAREYLSNGLMAAFIFFLIEMPVVSFILGFVFQGAFTSLITAVSISIVLSAFVFYIFTQYPKTLVSERSKRIDSILPFASLYLSTIAGTKLPLDQVFKFFGKNGSYGEVTDQIQMMNKDMEVFGLDIHTALQRAVDRAPSAKLKDMFWGLLSTSVSGGDIGIYLREKSRSQMNEYRLSIDEFSRKLALYIEIYLTAIILGSIFFVILTSLFSGISGVGNTILLQVSTIFIFLPLFSVIFMLLVRMTSPVEE